MIFAPLLARLATPLIIAGSIAAGVLGMIAYDRFIDDPAVWKEARRDYVHLTEVVTLEMQLQEERRLRLVAEVTRAGFERLLAETEARQAEETERREQEISRYETELEAAGRACRLDDADIDWLRQP